MQNLQKHEVIDLRYNFRLVWRLPEADKPVTTLIQLKLDQVHLACRTQLWNLRNSLVHHLWCISENQCETVRISGKRQETVRIAEKRQEIVRIAEKRQETVRNSEKQRETKRNSEKR